VIILKLERGAARCFLAGEVSGDTVNGCRRGEDVSDGYGDKEPGVHSSVSNVNDGPALHGSGWTDDDGPGAHVAERCGPGWTEKVSKPPTGSINKSHPSCTSGIRFGGWVGAKSEQEKVMD